MSNQKYILNKSKYVLSSLIGILVVPLGLYLSFMLGGGRLLQLVHPGEIFGILTVTLGALFFAYRTTAFKPWLTAFGIGVPQEEEIIKVYIRICDTTVKILLFAGVLIFLAGVLNSAISASLIYPHSQHTNAEEMPLDSRHTGKVEKQAQDTQEKPEVDAHGHPLHTPLYTPEQVAIIKFSVALTAPILSLLTICALVLPTRAKLAFLLNEQSLREAQLREKQRHIDNLGKA